MLKKFGKIALAFAFFWGIVGFCISRGHIDSVVPLMYVLIAVVALGFLIVSEP